MSDFRCSAAFIFKVMPDLEGILTLIMNPFRREGLVIRDMFLLDEKILFSKHQIFAFFSFYINCLVKQSKDNM